MGVWTVLKHNTTNPEKPCHTLPFCSHSAPRGAGGVTALLRLGSLNYTTPALPSCLGCRWFVSGNRASGRWNLRLGSQWHRLSIGQRMELTFSLTNGKQRLPKGPPTEGKEGKWRPRQSRLEGARPRDQWCPDLPLTFSCPLPALACESCLL